MPVLDAITLVDFFHSAVFADPPRHPGLLFEQSAYICLRPVHRELFQRIAASEHYENEGRSDRLVQ